MNTTLKKIGILRTYKEVKNKIKLQTTLIREMRSRNLSLNQLAKEIGISKSCLHGYVNGSLPSGHNLHVLKDLAEYFGLTIAQLLFDEKEEEQEEYQVLFSSFFSDNGESYRITLEKELKRR